MPKIKICGLFREEDIAFVNEARPDYIGFVFAKSRRQVTPSQAARLRSKLGAGIVPVGVFVNAPVKDIAALCRAGTIAVVQLHGGEDEGYIRCLREACDAQVIKAAPVKTRDDLLPRAAGGGADFLLLDHGAGGTGERFNWQLVVREGEAAGMSRTSGPSFRPSGFPYFLAGGVDVHTLSEALAVNAGGIPSLGLAFYGIDVSSGAETGGVKDRDKILRLVELVRKHEFVNLNGGTE
ncbi:MAG: phosphoribosylanthranilate isomerase [Treponema sp.]|jgi:phosphoribosylanthranilate isomerase|nr:phosphoribosylanthranilate isomerase [Treponema sp.]